MIDVSTVVQTVAEDLASSTVYEVSMASSVSGMTDVSLADAESAANEVYMAYGKASETATAAKKKVDNAKKAYEEAKNRYIWQDCSPESYKELQEAKRALEAAKAEEKAAGEVFEAAAKEAQAAADIVEQKKDELRRTRYKDTTYVVHCARVECTFGMRESYLALGPTHGVKTRQIPQMTVKDTVLDTNIINFGGCKSKENPTLKAAAEEAARKANEEIQKKKGFIDGIIDLFCGNRKIKVTDSLMEQCMGECTACFSANAKWRSGHKKVFINGEAVLLRRCSTRCIYGGKVTILLSGQPE